MLLSVVIPSHSRADLLARCLRSVHTHMPPGTEVIVIDDASRGGCVAEAASRFPGVHVERFARNRGFCSAANRGIALSRGAVVELLNDDAEVTAGWADAALRHFVDPGVAAVAPLVLIDGPDRDTRPVIDSAGDEFDPGGFARKRGHRRPLTDEFRTTRPVFGASGSSAFYRRAALEEVGPLPADFVAYFEDVDLACRLNVAGYRAVFEPDSLVYHRVSASHGTHRRRLIEQQSCNEERVYLRNVRGHRARHLAVLGGKALRRWREGRLLPWTVGRLRAWAELARVIEPTPLRAPRR